MLWMVITGTNWLVLIRFARDDSQHSPGVWRLKDRAEGLMAWAFSYKRATVPAQILLTSPNYTNLFYYTDSPRTLNLNSGFE